MNRVYVVLSALILSTMGFGASAADAMNACQADARQAVISTVSASTVIPTLVGHHREQAVRDDNRTYPMTSVSGRNNMHSTSVIYQ